MRIRQLILPACILVAATIVTGNRAAAQSIWMPPTPAPNFRIEVYKPNYDFDGAKFLTTAWFFSWTVSPTPNTALYIEIPFSHYDEESFFGTFESEKLIGNPYVGVIFEPEGSSVIGELGFRLPIASADNVSAAINGAIADFSRWEAFLTDVATIRARIGTRLKADSKGTVTVRLMGGMNLLVASGLGVDSEIMADADAGLWYQGPVTTLGATLSVKALMTEDNLDFSERSEFQLGLNASARFGQLEPGIHIHLPLSDDGALSLGNYVSSIIGVSLTAHLGGR